MAVSPPRFTGPEQSDTRDHDPESQRRPEPSLTQLPNEETPLLSHARSPPTGFPSARSGHAADQKPFYNCLDRVWKRFDPWALEGLVHQAFKSLPAVILGTLLNILDGVSYGMIIFPAAGIFENLGGMGVSMFFVSTLVAQLAYTFGGSSFAGANGSMMIEVVPFFHIMASTIAGDVGEENAREVIATTLVAFALSSLLTGLTFFLLGYLRLGVLIGFFPRHILVGCIGGVGIFLILTGLTVSTRLPSDALDPPTLETLRYFAFNPHALAQWVPPAVLAVLLRVITARWKHQLLFPIYFLMILIIFYIVVAAAKLDLSVLRKDGWLFDFAQGTGGLEDEWYGFYTYYDWHIIRWTPLWTTLPTQFALLFFNILHPPLNVPALAVSLDEDIDTNKELVGHGYSNLLAGIFGTVPNYLVYVNTLLFYRVGGGMRVAGFMLALATFLLLIIGSAPIAYLPVMVVGALIFVLGIDLVKEALWDTWHRVSRLEYITIISIMVTMTVWDFVIGVLFGIVVSCFFFVVQNSQRRSIRACYTGDAAMSTVRRPPIHRAYIREVSKQTRILQLQGFLFFGTIVHVEDNLRSMVNEPLWRQHPIRFVVVDLSLVGGVDMSSAEAFVRVQRLLAAKGVVLVFCGVSIKSAVGKALASVGILEEPYVELFETLNDAMEWTENAYLRAWFRARKKETTPVALPGRQLPDIDLHESLAGSPRRLQLRDAGDRTIATELLASEISSEPFQTLLKAFASRDNMVREGLTKLVPYFERVSVPEGLVLWEKEDEPDGLYIIESGILRASYKFADHTPVIEESMVSGTLAGELSALSGLPRNAKVIVERQAVLWKLSRESMRRLENDHPHLAQTFVRLVLKAAKVDTDVLLAALATR
ncbi:sulfate transporter family-domain-containing protein [Phlebopus sp. FC_14]|nr:sulfate transporter family-domain-containing protein [Phlebopus sp. FC_14]